MTASDNSRPLVSVIVVAYNAEDTIARCLDSIVNQSLHDIQLVIVNDGSSDDTQAVIDHYKAEDDRIVSVIQPNSGVSIARQRGLDLASGLFSIFVDSDDWIEIEMLKTLYCKALQESSDIVVCDYIEERASGPVYYKQKPKSDDSRVVLTQMFTELHGSLCNKLIRLSLYRNNRIRFIEGLNYREDECILIGVLSTGCKVSYVNIGLYHYDKKNAGSISSLWHIRPVAEYKLFISTCTPFFNTPELQKVLNERIANIVKTLTYAPKSYYPESRAFYRSNKSVFLNSNLPLRKKLFCVLYYNGFPVVASFRKLFQHHNG